MIGKKGWSCKDQSCKTRTAVFDYPEKQVGT